MCSTPAFKNSCGLDVHPNALCVNLKAEQQDNGATNFLPWHLRPRHKERKTTAQRTRQIKAFEAIQARESADSRPFRRAQTQADMLRRDSELTQVGSIRDLWAGHYRLEKRLAHCR